jgi:glycosyltransferase involved in cell wall biosynthesis
MLRPALTLPRRVLMTVDSVGGIWRYALDAARGLAAHGVECLLVGFGPAPASGNRRECESIANVKLVWTDAPLDWMVEDEAALQSVAEALVPLAAEWDADLLHLNVPSQAVGLPDTLPIVVAAHSCVPTWWEALRGGDLPAAWRWQTQYNRRGLDRADIVLAPSASHGATLRRVYGPLARVRVLHHGTSALPSVVPKEDFALAAGRWWDEGKNGACLDGAARQVFWPLVMAGPLDGPNGEHIALAFAETAGELPPEKMAALMRRAALFVAPSRYEPFGLAVLEAAISGAALVLADIPTFRELWGGAAEFVPARDVEGWSRSINMLAKDAERRTWLATRARRLALGKTLERQASGLTKIYSEAISRRVSRLAGVG